MSLSIILISIFLIFGLAVSTQSEYKETISVLQTLHRDEMQAMRNYQAYAENEWLGNEGFTRILRSLDYPRKKLSMDSLEEEILKFSNDIRLQDDITIIEIRFSGQSASG